MCYKVKIDLEKAEPCITIDGVSYSLEQLRAKTPKTKLEAEILRTVESCKTFMPKEKVADFEVDFDEITEIVKSDFAKGDNHSLCLLKGHYDGMMGNGSNF